MKKIFIAILILTFSLSAFAQKIKKPKLESTKLSAEQSKMINRGTELHDQKKFDEAIAIYQKIVDDCPKCALAVYEMAFSYFMKGDYDKSIELSSEAAKYQTGFLPLVYSVLAGSVYGKTKNTGKSIKIYKQAIKLIPTSPRLRFNLGQNYSRNKDFKNARRYYKEAIEQDFNFSIAHIYLADMYNRGGYKIPAILAASRVLAVDKDKNRLKFANTVFQKHFNGGAKKGDEPNKINIFLNLDAPKDEGDFSVTELSLSLGGALRLRGDDEDKDAEPKTTEEKFVDSVNLFITMLESDKDNKNTFVGKNYFPFFTEMKRKGHSEAFAYWILKQNNNLEAERWILNNSQKTIDFVEWAKRFSPKK